MAGEEHESNDYQLQVLTFVMTIEYNGFRYAGFQRQSTTPRITPGTKDVAATTSYDTTEILSSSSTAKIVASSDNGNGTSKNRRKNHSQLRTSSSSQQRPNKKAKKTTPTPITIQSQLETALQNWTNLSIGTLRLRGAGRTDKGVHALGQVVAFDVPLSLLDVEGGVGRVKLDDNESRKSGGDIGDPIGICNDALSEQSIQHLREAFHALKAHKSKTDIDENETIHTKSFVDQWQIRRAITTRLPADIVLRSVRMWTGMRPFEARKEISCKTYTYKLRFRCLSGSYHNSMHSSSAASQNTQHQNSDSTEKLHMHPICCAGPHILRRTHDQNAIWLCPWPLDPALLRRACNAFVGRHDFFNFVHKEERKRANKCTEIRNNDISPHEIDLFEFKVDTQPEEEEYPTLLPPTINATFSLKAKGFHRSMVRNLVGFVVDVARGLRSVEDIPMLLMERKVNESYIKSGIKSLASMVNSAPACGLCLAKVEYEHGHFL